MKKQVIWYSGICLLFIFLALFFIRIFGNEQKRIVYLIQNNKGSVIYDYEYDFTEANNRIKGYARPSRPSPFAQLLLGKDTLSDVVFVQLTLETQNDSIVETYSLLEKLKNLQHLHMTGRGVDSKILATLNKIKNLKSLDIVNTSLTNDEIGIIRSSFPDISVCGCPPDVRVVENDATSPEVASESQDETDANNE